MGQEKTVEFTQKIEAKLGTLVYGNDTCDIVLKPTKENLEVEFHINGEHYCHINLDEMAMDNICEWLEEKEKESKKKKKLKI